MSEFFVFETDQPWKLGLTIYFEPFLAYSFPAVHQLIDWSCLPEFLDTELQKMDFDNAEGLKVVDKLAKVRLLTGEFRMVLVHVEIQGQADPNFTQRMWTYYYRLRDKFHLPVISLAALADDDPNWKPNSYYEKFGGCELSFRFPIFKVLDASEAEGDFVRMGNPFALLVAAHRAALLTRHDFEQRSEERFRLAKYLLKKGLKREEVTPLFRLLSWMTKLPREMELKFNDKLDNFKRMEPELTIDKLPLPIEVIWMEEAVAKGKEEGMKVGKEEGLVTGLQLSVLDALETRLGTLPSEIKAKVHQLQDEDQLRQALRQAITAPTFPAFLAGIKP